MATAKPTASGRRAKGTTPSRRGPAKSAVATVEVRDGHHVELEVTETVVTSKRLYGAGHRLEVSRAQAEVWISAGDVIEVEQT